ncbi:hypothetical protein GCM10012275_45450 [Longimycelium tulufanense]|uniref:Uncharacterized protein n=2 Tax=Longimycelium tulufanense TaxID=907463 RepID=A0A8J3CF42_9PSEU|nr:hypothetical protein GCM10012275_45450 [Longimycelium tulufanense]
MVNEGEPETRPPAPRTAHLAVGFFLALAAFVVLQAILLWLNQDAMRRNLVDRGLVQAAEADAAVRTLLVQNTVVNVLFGAADAGFALLLRRGRVWARVALTVVGMLQLFLLLVGGGLTASGLVAFALLAAGMATLWLPATSRWLAELRSLR